MVLVLLVAVAGGTAALIGRVTDSSRRDAAQVLHLETIRRVAVEQRSLEREAALSGTAPHATLDRFDGLRAQMDAAFEELDALDARRGGRAVRHAQAARRAASYQHVLEQQLRLIHDGYVGAAEQFGETRVQALGAGLTEILAAEQALRLEEAAAGEQRADGVVLVTLLITAALLGAAAVVADRAQGASLAARAAEVRASEALGRHASDLVAVLDTSGVITWVGSSTGALLGAEADALLGIELLDLLHVEDRPALADALRLVLEATGGHSTTVAGARLADGRGGWRHLDLSLSDASAELGGIVLNGHDVSALTELQWQLRHQATHDGLTGLPNRCKLEADATRVLADARVTEVALLLVDLDDFKHVNDSLGHAAGDLLLIEATARLRSLAPPGSTPARLGGDEFALLLPDTPVGAAVQIGQDLVAALGATVSINGQRVRVGSSVGVAVARPGSGDIGSFLQHADAAMYAAKRAGKNRIRAFAPRMLAAGPRRSTVLADLEAALERDELVLHYQPVVDLRTGEVTQAEALLRWQHPERGLLPPSEVLPVAEDSGLIVPIGRWVLHTACDAALRWDGVSVAVNASFRELVEPTFCATVAEVLTRTGIAPHRLTLELTEQVFTEDLDEVLECLDQLAALGVRLAVDDFGAGCSSLQHLRRLPVDTLKIAPELVHATDEGAAGTAFVAAVVRLADTLGLETVAEGVEDVRQASAVRALGCTAAQGFHLAEAMPVEGLEAFLDVHAAHTGAAVPAHR